MAPVTVVMMLTLLLGLQPITTDLYLPALPLLQRELGASLAGAPPRAYSTRRGSDFAHSLVNWVSSKSIPA